MNWVLLAGSLIGVLALAGIAHGLNLGGDARISRDDAIALASEQGFIVADLALDRAGIAALARNEANNFMLIRRHGSHFVAHPLHHTDQTRLDHQFLSIGRVTLDLGNQAGIWAASLRRIVL